MFGFIKKHADRLIRKHQKQQLTQLVTDGIPLDRTWKLCEEILSKMTIKDYDFVTVHVAQLSLVRTPYRSVDSYLKTIAEITKHLKEESKISRGWSSFETQTVTIADWLMSEDGQFYLPMARVPEFLTKAQELLELMSQADGAELGVVAYNNSALIPFFVRLRDTLIDLYDVQFAL